jgi:hypothetical protein
VAIYSYQLARGQIRWMFTIDLPPAADGRRRQMNRKGFLSQDAALAAETEARKAYARADLAVDGSLAAELENWLSERELDLQPTTLSNYRDIIGYIKPIWVPGRRIPLTSERSTTSTSRCSKGAANAEVRSPERPSGPFIAS